MEFINSSDHHQYTLKCANKLYPDAKFDMNADFLQKMQTFFYTKIETVDFKNSPAQACQLINTWADEFTDHLI